MLDTLTIPSIAIAILDVGVFLYGAYWALEIRKALAIPLYRRQALWVGAIGVYFALFFFTVVGRILGVVSFGMSIATSVAAGAFIYAGVVMFFAWIDSTITIARRSDPLRRNTLKWSVFRWFFGFFVVVGTLLAFVFNAAYALTFAQATPLYGPIGGILLFGAIALLLSGKRSGDLVLRKHLKWFGLFTGILWITSAAEGTHPLQQAFTNPIVQAVSYSLFAVSAYFLYRSAKSLVPIGRLPLPDLAENKGVASNISTS
jgi:hypothetical protein